MVPCALIWTKLFYLKTYILVYVPILVLITICYYLHILALTHDSIFHEKKKSKLFLSLWGEGDLTAAHALHVIQFER